MLQPTVNNFMSTNPPELTFPAPSETALVEVPKMPKVFIAVATSDWKLELHTSESIRIIASSCKCETQVRYMMNDGVARARNNLAYSFLQTDCTHLFFLDSDIVIEPRQFQRLLNANKDIVCGLYPKKQPSLDWVVNYIPGEKVDENGYLKIKHAGTGALLITRKALEDMISKHPEMVYRGDPDQTSIRYDFFPMRAVDGTYLSEDWAFCNRVLEDGGSIYADTRCQLRHVGKIVYPLQFTITDDEMVDMMAQRYGMPHDHIRTFMASGPRIPGLMGGHRERFVRLWPKDYPIDDLHDGDVLNGSYDVPLFNYGPNAPLSIIDIGAGVGAFPRWAVKRWKGASVHCYDGDTQVFKYLEDTLKSIVKDNDDQKLVAYEKEVTPNDVPELPDAQILKLDSGGNERDLIASFQAHNKLEKLDAILVRYHDDMDVFFLNTLLSETHYLHCHQRYYGDKNKPSQGMMKFINRRLAPKLASEKQD
jgi:hypothetical protein